MRRGTRGEARVVVLADRGEAGPLEATVAFARAWTGDITRVVPVVPLSRAEAWGQATRGLDDSNILLEPRDRGTAAATLLAVVHLLSRAPGASVLVLSARRPPGPFDVPDLLAASRTASSPDNVVAIVRAGVVARVSALLRVFEEAQPFLCRLFLSELGRRGSWQPWQLGRLFQMIPTLDLHRDVLEHAPTAVRDLDHGQAEPRTPSPPIPFALEPALPISRVLELPPTAY